MPVLRCARADGAALDVDLSVESLRRPEAFPLVSGAGD
jgi:hypothetical protein